MEIVVHNSNWASNIGNSFFNLGVLHLLRNSLSQANIYSTDQLSALSGHNFQSLISKNDFQLPRFTKSDWFVITGPIFDTYFFEKYSSILQEVFKRNPDTKLVILNAGSINYDDHEKEDAEKFLEKFTPYVLTTRDTYTYNLYNGYAEYSYNGIDTAFFASKYYEPYQMDLENYVTICFDNAAEPKVELNDFNKQNESSWESVSLEYRYKHLYKFTKHFAMFNKYPKTLGGYSVVRPNHGPAREFDHVLFNKPNSFSSYTPYGYLNLYYNTELTISDRVHACIPTLSFGNPARLMVPSKRKKLFERIGLEDISKRIVTLDQDKLEDEYKGYLNFLSQFNG